MKPKTSKSSNVRTVAAPHPIGMMTGFQPSNPVLTAVLSEDEDVEWTWTTSPDGQQYVCGYTIVKKPGELSLPRSKRSRKSLL